MNRKNMDVDEHAKTEVLDDSVLEDKQFDADATCVLGDDYRRELQQTDKKPD